MVLLQECVRLLVLYVELFAVVQKQAMVFGFPAVGGAGTVRLQVFGRL